MDLAEEMLKYLINYALEHCADDLAFLSKRQEEEEKTKKAEERSMELIEKLKFVLDQPFERITYTEAIDILRDSKQNKKANSSIPSMPGVLTCNRSMSAIWWKSILKSR